MFYVVAEGKTVVETINIGSKQRMTRGAIGAMGLFPLIFVFDEGVSLGSGVGAWLPVIGAGAVVLIGYYLLNLGLTKIKSSVGSILSLFEPLSALVYGLVFFAEYPTVPTLVGAGLVVLSIVYLTRSQTRAEAVE